MVKELKKIHKEAQKAIKFLAAEFKFGSEIKEKVKQVKAETEGDEAKKAARDAHSMLKIYRWVARGEKKVAHSDDQLIKLLDELGEILPEEQKNQEEKFRSELNIASRILKKLASFYTGDIVEEIKDIEFHEKLLLKLENDPKHTDASKVKAALESELKKMEEDVDELDRWIKANDVLAENIDNWAAELERMTA